MLTTQLPGFADITRDSQQTFRTLLTALSEPGKPLEIPVALTPPKGLIVGCGSACLTLMDLETTTWLQPSFGTPVRDWLRFHAGCRFVDVPSEASFAVIENASDLTLEKFGWGSAETPEDSTTLLIQVSALRGGAEVTLTGPGIQHARNISPNLPVTFWQQWSKNHAAYPRGVDCFLFDGQAVVGLPRTVHAQVRT